MHPSTNTKTKEEKEHDKRLRALKTAGWFDRMNPFRDKSKDMKNAQSTRVTSQGTEGQIFDQSITNPVEQIRVQDSTAISDAKYNSKNGDMNIKFRSGNKWYTYPGVSEEEADAFQHAASKGQAYWSQIQPHSINA